MDWLHSQITGFGAAHPHAAGDLCSNQSFPGHARFIVPARFHPAQGNSRRASLMARSSCGSASAAYGSENGTAISGATPMPSSRRPLMAISATATCRSATPCAGERMPGWSGLSRALSRSGAARADRGCRDKPARQKTRRACNRFAGRGRRAQGCARCFSWRAQTWRPD